MNANFNSISRYLLPLLTATLLLPVPHLVAQTKPPTSATNANAPAALDLHVDLIYAMNDEAPLKLDLALPKDGQAPYPVVIILHGTGISKGRIGVRKHAEALAESGYAALAVGFRHDGKDPYPAALKDVTASLDWVHANAAKYGFDKNRIAALGFSGGGSLATLLGAQKPLRLRAVVSYFAPSDLALLHQKSTGFQSWFIKSSLER